MAIKKKLVTDQVVSTGGFSALNGTYVSLSIVLSEYHGHGDRRLKAGGCGTLL